MKSDPKADDTINSESAGILNAKRGALGRRVIGSDDTVQVLDLSRREGWESLGRLLLFLVSPRYALASRSSQFKLSSSGRLTCFLLLLLLLLRDRIGVRTFLCNG
jgi:hypothetical protein